ncbi:KAP family P-loop domain-containing protein [Kushneria avicenniae]|uniref:KAP family P-loop domain-containing protein n=1 Tax=Kushneria avicenniae TaxID=402385 RepID=A0A1I1JKY8_9GAMM|nr:P-loop NTPase fold protein [Kushneria avicenniae]SFC48831.1 KAP family P-loop domain-containing protein [Kushneria avicenniae]
MGSTNNSLNLNSERLLRKYIVSEDKTDYAFLIDGAWGAGKTFFVENVLESLPPEIKGKCVKVSLHGISDINFLYEELVFDNFYKKRMRSKWKKLTNGFARATFKRFRIDSSVFSEAVLNVFEKPKIYIFDDIERCGLKDYELLGLADKLISTFGSKVVLIAHQEELLVKMPEFKKIREKVIGKTVKVNPSPEIVLNDFLDKSKCSRKNEVLCKEILGSAQDSIFRAYEESSLNNLRLLKRALLELEHIFKLTQGAKLNQAGNEALAYAYTAFYLEYHGGDIKNIDVDKLGEYWFGGLGEEDKKLAALINEKYKNFNFSKEVLPAKFMLELVSKASLSDQDVLDQLELSPYYNQIKFEKSWRSVWRWSQKNAEEVEVDIARFESDWTKQNFIEFGDIMHAAGIKIWLARIGVINMSVEESVRESKVYIDNIYSHDQFSAEFPYESLSVENGFLATSYENLGYFESDSSEFAEITRYLVQKVNCKLKGNIRKDVLIAYKRWTENPQSFFEKLSKLDRHDGGFADTSFFEYLNAYQFYKDFLRLHASVQLSLMINISVRHRSASKIPRSEKIWLRKFARYVYTENTSLHKLDQERMRYMYRNFLKNDQMEMLAQTLNRRGFRSKDQLLLSYV